MKPEVEKLSMSDGDARAQKVYCMKEIIGGGTTKKPEKLYVRLQVEATIAT